MAIAAEIQRETGCSDNWCIWEAVGTLYDVLAFEAEYAAGEIEVDTRVPARTMRAVEALVRA